MNRAYLLYPFFLISFLLFVSIVSAQPLSGIKTIGGENPDYPTIHAAVDSLNARGAGQGGVRFQIRNGTYTENAFAVTAMLDANRQAIFGVDSGATVTVTLNGTVNDTGLLKLRCRYVTFDGSWNGDIHGRHLSFSGSPTLILVWIADSASYNTVKNCILNDLTNWTAATTLVVGFYNPSSNNNRVVRNRLIDCDIIGGLTGINHNGYHNEARMVDSTEISYCNVFNFRSFGIDFYYSSNIEITHNRIYTNIPATSGYIGIIIDRNVNVCKVDANHIGPLVNAPGEVYGILSFGATGSIFSNNMINLSASNTSYTYGISVNTSHPNKYLNNSISLVGNDTIANSCAFYYSPTTVIAGDSILGNIFQNTCSGGVFPYNYHSVLYSNGSINGTFSDYNLLTNGSNDSTDNRFIARAFNSSYDSIYIYNTLSELRASNWGPRDTHSISELAPFDSDSDLHIQSGVPTGLESGALHHWQVPTDYDGDIRTSPMCDIGADEGNFTPLSIRHESVTTPNTFSLSTIYPNPFNSTATIRFSLPITSNVKGEVFDITGRRVSQLLNGKVNAGEHRIQFDGSKLASGMYFVRLTAGKTTVQQKMILLK